MSFSGTMQSVIKVFARYCSDCMHRNVCIFTDEVRKYEEQCARWGTGTGCYMQTTFRCTEKKTDMLEKVPEIIRCKDCRYVRRWRDDESAKKFGQIYECVKEVFLNPKEDNFCSKAERRGT